MEQDLLLFRIENYLCAIQITDAPYCFRAVEIIPIPAPSEFFPGLIDFHGSLIPVFDIRKKFKLPAQQLRPSDSMLKLQGIENPFIIVVDEVTGFFKVPEESISPVPEQETSDLPVKGLFPHEGKTVYLLDITNLLSNAEQIDLNSVTVLLHPDSLPDSHAY